MAKASKYKINNPAEAAKYKSNEKIVVGKTIYLIEGVKPRGGVTDTTKKKSTTTTTTENLYPNIPAGFDRAGLSKDQLSIADSIFKTVGATPTIDTSNLTQQEIEGFVTDATNALDPYFKEQQKQTKDQFEQARADAKQSISRSLEDIGITDSNLKSDISTNITRLNEDKLVAEGKINQSFIDDVRNRQDTLEQQGLTFSGEAIRQLGTGSAYQTTTEGETERNKRLANADLSTAFNRNLTDLNTQLSRKGSVLDLSHTDIQNLTPEQISAISSSKSDIDRAISRAYQDKNTSLGRLDTAQSLALNQLSGERSFQLRSLVGDEVNQQLNLGRRLPSNYSSLIKFPQLG